MIELAILGVLQESDLHGYELKKRLREVLGPLSSVSFGSLYPALARLEAAGAVKAVEAAEPVPTIPMTGSFTGEAAAFRSTRAMAPAQGAARTLRRKAERGPRGKKVYGITEEGAARLCVLIADPTDDDRTFNVKLAFCRFCDPATRLGLLRRRREALAARLAERRNRPAKAADRYRKALLEHDTETVERDIAWLDGLIASEENS